MKIHIKDLYKLLLFILVVLPIYQDSPLSLYLGVAGYSLLMPFSLIAISLYAFLIRKLPINSRLSELVHLGIWMVIISYVAILVWLVFGNPIIVVKEFLPTKALKVCLQYFSYPSYVALILIVTRKVGVNSICKYAFVTLILLTIICLIEKGQSPYAFEGIHFAGTFPYWRIRLLTTESSWTAMMIYVYFILALYWCFTINKKFPVMVAIICIGILLYNTSSKTLMMSVVVTVIIYVVIVFKKIKKTTLLYLLVILAVMVIFAQIILPQLIQSISIDIQEYTSVATRLYTSILGLLIGICFPCGVGGAVYLGIFQNALSEYLYIFTSLPIKFNISEILSLATRKTDEALTVKSGMLQFNMYWGIVGTIYLMYNFVRLSSQLSQKNMKYTNIIVSAFWCAVILVITASNFSFEFWLLYAFIMCLNEEH